MKNLAKENVLTDYGGTSGGTVRSLEKSLKIRLPEEYVQFITKHDGASLHVDVFDYFNMSKSRVASDSIGFKQVGTILRTINSLLEQSTNDPSDPDIFKFYEYFDEDIVPFGETGGGDLICFDYRNHAGNNPPIILWLHDVEEERISFIANNFEEFINMLHEPED
ncbi:MAG: SMI1/KNR4 family protein [Holosporales bacterium]|jgi:cell wall assembly regulator SMI1|nr:SMI1/KNR4 family protein [Holosporales bacterium]